MKEVREVYVYTTGWPRTLEHRENDEKKNSLNGKIREFDKNKKIREKSGNFTIVV